MYILSLSCTSNVFLNLIFFAVPFLIRKKVSFVVHPPPIARFPFLNNRPRLSSNTADGQRELAARKRKWKSEQTRVYEREREREVDWRLVLHLLFLHYRYCPVTEKRLF